MALTASDGGGGGIGGGFPGNPKYYDPGIIHGAGGGQVGGSLDAPSAVESAGRDLLVGVGGGMIMDMIGSGAFDKVHDAMSQANPEQLTQMATAWGNVRTAADNHQVALASAISKLESAWEGDDADTALPIMRGLHATMARQVSNAARMQSAFQNMAQNMTSMKNTYGHGQSVAGFIGNSVTGGDDRAAAHDYNSLLQAFKSDMDVMPDTVPSEIKVDGQYGSSQSAATPGLGSPGGAPSMGGPGSAAHVGGPTSPTIGKPPELDNNSTLTHPERNDDDIDGTRPEITDPGRNDYTPTPYDPSSYDPSGYDPSHYSGGGAGISPGGAGLNTDGSLAGLGGGAGALGGGAGGAGLGGLDPNAAGAGAGAGLGGGANGALGAGSGAGGFGPGAGGTAGGAAGVGGRGMMMPMHGQHGGDDDERERTTWLSEDDDIWGAEENLPGVIH